jgi:NAD dependent epimerase/dehydratase
VSLAGKTCLVTGGGGFIGSHLVEMLVREGARTRALVHYNALGRRGWLDQSPEAADAEVYAGDVADRDSLRSAMRGVDVVLHLAALIAIPYSYHAPESYVRTNVLGTLNVLRAAQEAGASRVVHTSTSEVYGSAQRVPMDESHPLQGQSPYSASKIGADKMAEAMHLSFDTPVVIVRPFNTYGPRQSTRAVLPTIITQCLSGRPVRLGSLHPTRDLTFVTDTARGFVMAATAPGVEGRTVNLGTGREVSVGELAEAVARAAGVELRLEHDPERVRPSGSEVDRLLSDNTLAARLFGWTPEHSLEAGLEATVAWFRENLDGYRVGEYAI